jgi:tetratricopeptide (TPR) repeat protein
MVNTTLCLNMIVKNESRVILRMLKSVVGVIDSYCICDTGSTDNTSGIISSFFQSQVPPIPGRIIFEPFKDFGYNRSFALAACDNADYVLLLDADMILELPAEFDPVAFKNGLRENAYHFFQGSRSFHYKNVRIVKNNIGASYWGVTHEYVKLPEGSHTITMPISTIFINDVGDGGSKGDKFERDVRLLKQGLVDVPNNERYTFYLANTFKDNRKYSDAIEYYKKRAELGGWFEEVWFSYYSIGNCYKEMGDMVNAVHYWMEAFQYFPQRLENLYEIISHYRYVGKNNLSYLYCDMALKKLKQNPTPDYLFLQKGVYDYKLLYEMSVIGYYCNIDKYDLVGSCMAVFNCGYTDEGSLKNTMSNYKFYSPKLSRVAGRCTGPIHEVGVDYPGFVASTPSIVKQGDEYVVCRRFVNYRIDDKGGYVNKEKIQTINVIARFNSDLTVKLDEFVMDYDTNLDDRYVGLEDVRLFVDSAGKLKFNANRGISDGRMMIEHGEIAGDTTQSGFIVKPQSRNIEKNWVLFTDPTTNTTKVVYDWSPLTIGDLVPDEALTWMFIDTHANEMPAVFKHVRGSTNGVQMGNEIWFLCHLVSYEDRRFYYHMFVMLDAETFKLKRYTRLFTFDGEKVEYSLGFVERGDNLLIGYSRMDRETDYLEVPKEEIERLVYDERKCLERGFKQ